MKTIHLCLFMMLCLGVHRSSSEILQRQKRNWIIDSFSIDEGYEGDFPYSLGKIEIEKDLTIFKIHGQGVDEEPKGILQINEYTGEITVHKPVDFEEYPVFKLTFQALDRENHVVDTQLGIEIKIIDSNDNAPKFYRERYEVSIEESILQGTEVITVRASDHDSGNDGIFNLRIVSVTPKPHDLDFYLTHITGTQIGKISFNGCLDHEKAEKYTIIVEAKDNGKKKRLSSSCTVIINIEDGNNHLPEITGHTGPGRVKEREENALVSRVQVTDKDTKGTAAWRAKYEILGDTNDNFRITTDPETNEGLLYVKKHLDYENSPLKNLTISAENEIPYHSCKVVSRSATGLWKVVTNSGTTISDATGTETLRLSTVQVTVTVEDVNESPIFDKPNKKVKLGENVKAGQYLETFTARDPDVTSANTFVYIKGEDPADWVTVDPVTGIITTSKILDRESSFVKDNIYSVTIYAVDNGNPLMTGTATLSILISDDNDNAPNLAVSTIDMCQSDGPSLANVTVIDLDEEPYGGPFRFKLREDFGGKWKVDSGEGYSVKLTKEKTVHSGYYDLVLEVTDRQGEPTLLNLSVTVCSCLNTAKPDCRTRKATSSNVGGGTLGIVFFGILLLAGLMLMAFMMSCEKPKLVIPDELSGQLMNCNTEKLGTDCKVVFEPIKTQKVEQIQIKSSVPPSTLQQLNVRKTTSEVSQTHSDHTISQTEEQRRKNLQWLINSSEYDASQARAEWALLQRKSSMEQRFTHGSSMHWSMGASSTMRTRHQHRNTETMHGTWVRHGKYPANQESGVIQREILLGVLNKTLHTLQAQGEELGDYAPRVYAEEEDTWTTYELDAISISDISFDPDFDQDLNFKFSTLASICMPSESTVYSTKTSWVMENQQL